MRRGRHGALRMRSGACVIWKPNWEQSSAHARWAEGIVSACAGTWTNGCMAQATFRHVAVASYSQIDTAGKGGCWAGAGGPVSMTACWPRVKGIWG